MNSTDSEQEDLDLLHLKSLSILYVEDEDELRDQLKPFLQRRCRQVYMAANGKKGLEAFTKHSPDIVVTDILMPIMDGLKMAEQIKKRNPNVPLIIITAFEEPRYFHQAIELGVSQYINKPIMLPVLQQALLKSSRMLRAEAALKEVEERYRLLFKLSHLAISVSDTGQIDDKQAVIKSRGDTLGLEGILSDCNDAFLKMLGYSDLQDFNQRARNLYRIMTDESTATLQRCVQEELLVRGFTHEFELELINARQETVPVLAQMLMRYSESGEPMEVWTFLRDLREQRKTEQQLRLSAQVFESSRDAIIISDQQNNIVSVNRAFIEITGYQENDVIGKNPSLLSSGRHDNAFYQGLWAKLNQNGYWQGEIWNRRKTGELYPEWLSISTVHDKQDQLSYYIAIFSDITHIKEAESNIEFLANYDPLTKLPNRRLFINRLDQSIKMAMREKKKLAVLFFDLDRFKVVNDTLGHSVGDQLLVEVGRRLTHCLRDIDSVSRLSGDEFAALISDINDIGNVVTVAKKIIASMREVFKIESYELHVTVSIGISLFPNDGKNYEILLKNADTAMYHAKNAGRDNFEFFSAAMSTQALERLSLESSLCKAVEQHELLVYYQPQVDINSGRIIAMEALLRWPHSELGMIAPDKFVTLAEETGLIMPIGDWVLREVCRQNHTWQEQGIAAIPVAVNLSAVQFRQHNLLEIIQGALRDSGMKAQFLELELNEKMLMDSSEFNVGLLNTLRQLGVRLVIDDFGTGYSSLSYLSRFPLSKLKIDRSFCYDIPHDKKNASIARAIISLGHELELSVVAEGVEQSRQLNFLQAQQCDSVQGYLFSEPVPAEEMRLLLENQYITSPL